MKIVIFGANEVGCLLATALFEDHDIIVIDKEENRSDDFKKLDIRVGIISGAKADLDVIKEYASIPSRDGLLTMLASGMIQYVRDLSIALNLYAEKMEGEEK